MKYGKAHLTNYCIISNFLFTDLQSSVSTVSRPPNLGVVVYMLRQCTNQFLSTYESHKHSMRKLDSVAALSTEELDEVRKPHVKIVVFRI